MPRTSDTPTPLPPGLPAATVVITTKDRRDDLREALATVVAQTADVEILVIDDGSSDGTSEMVRAEFPQVRLHRSDTSHGLIVQRNVGAGLARSPIVVSIDDDARFPSVDTVTQTLADFDDPAIGAVAIPFVDVRYGPEVKQRPPDAEGTYVTSTYIGTAHAIRRDVFLTVGGYREDYVHMAEEPELCLRMLATGHVVRLGRADPIHHLESPKRIRARNLRLVLRNGLLYAWRLVPMPYLLVRLAKILVTGPIIGARHGHLRVALAALAEGLRAGPREWRTRRPVPRSVYRLDHDIRKGRVTRLQQAVARLPQPVVAPLPAAVPPASRVSTST